MQLGAANSQAPAAIWFMIPVKSRVQQNSGISFFSNIRRIIFDIMLWVPMLESRNELTGFLDPTGSSFLS